MNYFLALDSGGTKTECVLADEERELARVRAGTIKVLRAEEELAGENLKSLLDQVEQVSGIDLKKVNQTCVGTSGGSVPHVVQWIRDNLKARVGGEIEICGDEVIGLDAAFPGQPGILVIAGTGSNIVGRSASGVLTGAGGTGPALADEGSGHWIGHQALRHAFRALDERRPCILIDEVIRHWELASIEELIGKANTIDTDFSTLTPIVVSAAEQNDAVAQEVLRLGGVELARYVLLVIRHLREVEDFPEEKVPSVALVGSVAKNVHQVRDAMTAALKERHPFIQVLPGVVDPIQGALWRARQHALSGNR